MCGNRYRASGIDVNGYNTVENAADMVDLRRALDVRQWVLDGTSYGGRLAQEVLRQDPAGVSGMLLDSPLTYAPQGPSTLIARATDAQGRLGAACDAEPRCASVMPDIAATLAAAQAALDARTPPQPRSATKTANPTKSPSQAKSCSPSSSPPNTTKPSYPNCHAARLNRRR